MLIKLSKSKIKRKYKILFKLVNVKINECFCFNLKKRQKILVYIKQKMLFVYAILKDKQNINLIYSHF